MKETTTQKPKLRKINVRKAGTIRLTASACSTYAA